MSSFFISGFTFIRNAIQFDFPIKECIASMLPLVDELIVNVGNSNDGTEKLIEKIKNENPFGNKIKIIESIWDDSITKDGLILSEQTNIALKACTHNWCLYLQADEALHEQDYSKIKEALEEEELKIKKGETCVDGFAFKYFHFYGGYTLIQQKWNWYPNEIRVIRKNSGAQSFGDAQTFRLQNGKPLNVKLLDAYIYHYGHAREPQKMQKKIQYFHRFWHGDKHNIKVEKAYDLNLKELVWFWGTHPLSYQERVKHGLTWSLKPSQIFQNNENFNKVIIISSIKNNGLAHEIKSLLQAREQNKKFEIFIFNSLAQFFIYCIKNFFNKKNSSLIDLEIENRSILKTLFLAPLFFFCFSWRIGFSSSGQLSSFKKKLFNVINWQKHEKKDLGFIVPHSSLINNFIKWLGIE